MAMSGGAGTTATVYRVGLVRWQGGADAVVFDLPGCSTIGPDRDAVLGLIPVAIAEHLAWLDEHGDVTRDAFPLRYEVVEEVDLASAPETADGEIVFQDDLRSVTSEEVEAAARRMGYARRDLLSVVRALPDSVLDWEPPATAVNADPWAPGIRSIRAILLHVASADGYYAGNVGDAPQAAAGEADRGDLFGARERTLQHLRSLAAGERSKLYKRRQPWQAEGYEHWTVRKALRRIIAHERFHTREVQQRLAWILLGVPAQRQE